MNKPTLVIMAAGMGSRYGGLKQIAPVDSAGHLIIDYSLYDARRAGFESVVFVITKQLEEDFREVIGNRIAKHMDVKYAFQSLENLPEGFSVPEGRTKPWGTAQAVLSAKDIVNAPFCAINADDYYGSVAFDEIYQFLANNRNDNRHAMVGYQLKNTLTENGHVARGVCKTDDENRLVEIIERVHIESRSDGGAYTEDGENFVFLPGDTIVSMNMWGFALSMMGEVEARFAGYLKEYLPINPLKCEYFLPLVPNALLKEGKVEIEVLSTPEKWYGVTYAADMPVVQAAIAAMKQQGKYPEKLWGIEK